MKAKSLPAPPAAGARDGVVLVIGRLRIASSYARDVEGEAAGAFDTVQFCIRRGACWRIRTYARDHDIHVHTVAARPDQRRVAAEHIAERYGDVLAELCVVELAEEAVREGPSPALGEAGLFGGKLEVAKKVGFAFWNPDGGVYRTQSKPR